MTKVYHNQFKYLPVMALLDLTQSLQEPCCLGGQTCGIRHIDHKICEGLRIEIVSSLKQHHMCCRLVMNTCIVYM